MMEMNDICRLVARTLMAEIGPWGERCALFGGLVPGLLVPEPPSGLAPHIGTRDVDLALRVAALGDEREMYRTLKQNLAGIGFSQNSLKSFEWRRGVGEVEVIVELFVPVEDPTQGGKVQRKPIEDSGSGLTALGIYGLELIKHDIKIVPDEGPLLDDKGVKRVDLRVCGPAMLLALKAWALTDRNKTKDGYDVVWMLKALGPQTIAERFREAQLQHTDFGAEALARLETCFSTPEHTGPVGWISESFFEDDEAAREKRDAVGLVREFLSKVRS